MSSVAEQLRFLGVDGGGTKTAFVLVDGTGTVLASALAPSCYYLGHGIGLVEEVLGEGVSSVLGQSGLRAEDLSSAFFALPGYGEVSADVSTLDAIPGRLLGMDRYACDNDMVAGWAGSLGAVDGVNVIAGTGSMTYGEHGDRGLRVGGWGELFDDEGSAYWIAVRGLAAFAKMSDGRLPRGPLVDTLTAALDLTTDLDLVDVVLNRWQGDRSRIASLAPVVTAAAGDGDEVCRVILQEAGGLLAGLVRTTIDRLAFPEGHVVPVSWSGGVFGSNEVRAAFREGLDAETVDLREPLLEPVVGSALYAARLHRTPLDAAAIARLRSRATTITHGGSNE